MRATTIVHAGSGPELTSSSQKNVPKPSAASAARPTEALPAARHSGSGSRETSTTPAIATAAPRAWIAAGSSPCASPATTGTMTPSAPIVATTLTEPSAIAR